MQGKKTGERPTTGVKTQAEKDKFEREAYQFLITPERRRELGGLPATQTIDFNLWAERWNEDVAETERNVLAGRLEPVGDPTRQINRKQPFDLSIWWTESKKHVNTARTIENHQAQLQSMYRNNRIRLSTPSTAGSAAIGVTQGGALFPFPLVDDGRDTRPRPAPQLASDDAVPYEQGDVSDHDSMIDVGEDDGIGPGGGVERANVGETIPSASKRRAVDGGASGEACEGSSSADSGGGSGRACGGASWRPSAKESTTRARDGDGAFVVPAAACSNLQSVAPTFGTGMGLAAAAQVWNPQPPVPPPAPSPSPRARSCQICGHNPAMARWTSSHSGGGRWSKKVCSVPANLRRPPNHPRAQRNRFVGCCTCNDCKLG